jgi:hypothetical protein
MLVLYKGVLFSHKKGSATDTPQPEGTLKRDSERSQTSEATYYVVPFT